jgi:hypothetical protein
MLHICKTATGSTEECPKLFHHAQNSNKHKLLLHFVMPKGKYYKMSVGFVWFPSVIIADASPYWLYSSFMLHSENETMMYFYVQNTIYMNFPSQTAKYKMYSCFLHVT